MDKKEIASKSSKRSDLRVSIVAVVVVVVVGVVAADTDIVVDLNAKFVVAVAVAETVVALAIVDVVPSDDVVVHYAGAFSIAEVVVAATSAREIQIVLISFFLLFLSTEAFSTNFSPP